MSLLLQMSCLPLDFILNLTRLAESTKRRCFRRDPVAYLKQVENKFVS
ncbi:hypothetical protein ABH892_002952 [Paenibacillus sp. RC254]